MLNAYLKKHVFSLSAKTGEKKKTRVLQLEVKVLIY